MKRFRHLLLASLTLAAGGTQAANLVTNGSFEDTAVSAGSFILLPNLAGWTGGPDIEVRNGDDGVAFEGRNFVELDTFANSRMTQTIVGSGIVKLSFWFSARATPSVPAGSNGIGFSLGDLSGVVLVNTPGGAAHDWQVFSGLADLGTAGSATLTFEVLGLSDQFGGSLDNITVSAVPLPGAFALMLSGLGTLRLVRRRCSA